MLGFKAATADVGQWVRGPNEEQKHSLPLVTWSQWAWSPRGAPIQHEPSKGPWGPRSHALPAGGGSVSPSLALWQPSLSLSLSLALPEHLHSGVQREEPVTAEWNLAWRGQRGAFLWPAGKDTRLFVRHSQKFIHEVSKVKTSCLEIHKGWRNGAAWMKLADHEQHERSYSPPLTSCSPPLTSCSPLASYFPPRLLFSSSHLLFSHFLFLLICNTQNHNSLFIWLHIHSTNQLNILRKLLECLTQIYNKKKIIYNNLKQKDSRDDLQRSNI